MTRGPVLLLIATLTAGIAGCGRQSSGSERDFTKKTQAGIVRKAKVYPLRAYQQTKVPTHAFVKLSGQIVKTDSGSRQVGQGDRFILKRKSLRVQVLNQATGNWRVGEHVTVYGEYYGFIKSYVVKVGEKS